MYNSNNEFFMSPKNDYVFKKIFGDENNKDILSSFLSCVINEQINDVSILNNEITKENTADKKSILDIRATINDGVQIDIEIQLSRTIYMPARSLYYWSKIYMEQLQIGQIYKKLNRTICINILDFISTESKKYHSVYRLKETEENFELTNLMEIHFIEIPKLKGYEKNDMLSQWINFINADSREELKKMAIVNKNIDKAFDILNVMSQNKEERAAYLSREMALHDEVTKLEEALQEGRQEGLEEGRQEGLEEGEKKKALEIAKNLLDILDNETIAIKTGLTLDEIENLRK